MHGSNHSDSGIIQDKSQARNKAAFEHSNNNDGGSKIEDERHQALYSLLPEEQPISQSENGRYMMHLHVEMCIEGIIQLGYCLGLS